jgi:hypothetical protein
MVAAGGLAAALSTADGLLLTIANALSHDLYYKMIDPNAPTARRVTISKALLLVVALARGYVAAQKPADILFLVSAAFSFAAAAFFPALVLGIFWKRANKWGASLGMVAGLGITFYYMVTTQPWLRGVFGVTSPVRAVVGHPADLGRPVRRAAGLCGDHHRQPADPAPSRRRRNWWSTCATQAHYLCVNIEADQAVMAELEHAFKFNDAVLRHLTVVKKEGRHRPVVHDEDRRARRSPQGPAGGVRSNN